MQVLRKDLQPKQYPGRLQQAPLSTKPIVDPCKDTRSARVICIFFCYRSRKSLRKRRKGTVSEGVLALSVLRKSVLLSLAIQTHPHDLRIMENTPRFNRDEDEGVKLLLPRQ
jgi:hypothetical protein